MFYFNYNFYTIRTYQTVPNTGINYIKYAFFLMNENSLCIDPVWALDCFSLNRRPQAKQKETSDRNVYQNIKSQDAIFPILEM